MLLYIRSPSSTTKGFQFNANTFYGCRSWQQSILANRSCRHRNKCIFIGCVDGWWWWWHNAGWSFGPFFFGFVLRLLSYKLGMCSAGRSQFDVNCVNETVCCYNEQHIQYERNHCVCNYSSRHRFISCDCWIKGYAVIEVNDLEFELFAIVLFTSYRISQFIAQAKAVSPQHSINYSKRHVKSRPMSELYNGLIQ